MTTTKVDEESLRESDRRFRHLLNAVILFGPGPVREAAQHLDDLHMEILVEWWTRLREERERGGTDPVGFAFPMHRTSEWDQALKDLIEAMRNDVAAN